MSEAVEAFTAAWRALHESPLPSSPGDRARRNNAARTVAAVADREMTRIIQPRLLPPVDGGDYTHSAFDWERLRVNVAHLVAPRLVKWEERA